MLNISFYCLLTSSALKIITIAIEMSLVKLYPLIVFLFCISCKKEEGNIPGKQQLQTIPANDTLQAIITGNTLLTNTHTWYIQDWVYISNEATIQIEPGTVIDLLPGKKGSGLIITRGSKILAKGQPYFPISILVKDTVSPIWNGIVLLGRNSQSKMIFSHDKLVGGREFVYGGYLPEDTSAIMQYVHMDYVPLKDPALTPGVLLMGTGSGTVIKDISLRATGKKVSINDIQKD
ncbi:hypothetical protein SAMN05428988_3067 [Chitinophaga sp. YR573]|nr:hypothetical protein SAMN05428988_3067 [Chitinophaga sp. YR573]